MTYRCLVVLISVALFAAKSGVRSATLAKDANWINSLKSDQLDDAEIESLSVDDAHTGQDLERELGEIARRTTKKEFDDFEFRRNEEGSLQNSATVKDPASDDLEKELDDISKANAKKDFDEQPNKREEGSVWSFSKLYDTDSEAEDPSSGSAQSNNNNNPKSIEEINEEQKENIPVKIEDGDIAVDPNAPQDDYEKRSSQSNMHWLWLDRVIPYEFDSSLSDSARTAIKNAMAHYENKTCLKFTNDTTNRTHWINFVKSVGCWSYVGRFYYRPGSQKVSIGSGCESLGTILHEIMHAIGFNHEQSRYDRNQYVEVFWENIKDGKEGNFQKKRRQYSQLFGTQYDYKGIMHYGKHYFSKNGKPTLLSLRNPAEGLGQRKDFTADDLREINELYQCKKKTGHFTEWSSWGPCGVKYDNTYEKKRQRYCYEKDVSKCTKPATATVSQYGIVTESKALTCADCKLDGHWGKWSLWGAHEGTCGFAKRNRTRICWDPRPRCGGAPCNGTSTDDGQVYLGSCSLGPYDCEFENKTKPLCHWQNLNANTPFLVGSGSTPSSNTGPTGDATPVLKGAGSFIYTENSVDAAIRGQLAKIKSMTMPATSNGKISFKYHMYGRAITYLKLSIQTATGTKILWQKIGNKGNQWNSATVSYTSNTDYALIFESKIAAWYAGDVALDEIMFPSADVCKPNPCQNGGFCSVVEGTASCSCPAGYTGKNCETAVDKCNPNPCQNGGSCTSSNGGYTCLCPAGYTGLNCETQINYCNPNPCQNGGSCNSVNGGYTCLCPAGYTGLNCETLISYCNPNPCQNGGSCNSVNGGYTCLCPAGYTGLNCETQINYCNNYPCRNGGSCTSSNGGYTCLCVNGFTGSNCDTLIIHHCSPNPCQNGGSCNIINGGYKCLCLAGYTGVNCETLISYCNPNPCQNGGSCNSVNGGYTCLCPAGYTGLNCETLISYCNPNPCQNGGSCNSVNGSYTCLCPAGYTGLNCETLINYCNPNPCQNGGSCNSVNGGYTCLCPAGYTGLNCETLINYCNPNPCQNGGSCNSVNGGYTCLCPAGYTGLNCETQINYCNPNPCQNGGSCNSVNGSYTCLCPAGYTGLNCETQINYCNPNPCQNGGSCNSVNGSYTCLCPAGYTGLNCETQINHCNPNPCKNGGSCTNSNGGYKCSCTVDYTGVKCESKIDYCSPNPCQNAGSCVNVSGGFKCLCRPGFTGLNCETKIDYCSPNPCQNGASCISYIGGYKCLCRAGYTGVNCETKIDYCSPNPCQNGGSCTSSNGGYKCWCPAGYTGLNCETKIVNYCSPNPCQNGGSCTSSNGGYKCWCPAGYTGLNCETKIVNYCNPNPCQNGGSCTSVMGGYTCWCPAGYTGLNCETSISSKFVDLVTCNFECGFCSLKQHKVDKFDWTRRAGRTPSWYTGPSYDHTTLKDGFYAYTEVSRGQKGHNAILSTPDMESDGKTRCLDFYYHMYGSGMGSFTVQTEVAGIRTDVFKKSGNKGRRWYQGLADITAPAGKKFKILFESIRGLNWRGDVAIDDIRLWEGACPIAPQQTASVLPCLFERGFCEWSPVADRKGYWTDGKRYHFAGKKDVNEANDDGSVDNEISPSSDKEAVSKRARSKGPRRALSGKQDDFAQYKSMRGQSKGILKSKPFSTSQDVCMRFYAHMYGKRVGHLIVREKSSGAELLKLTGSQGKHWFENAVNIPAGQSQTIEIEAKTSKAGWDSPTIAIDDIEVAPGKCKSKKELFKCDFESGNCGFEQDDVDTCDWKIASTNKGKALQWSTQQCTKKYRNDAFLLKLMKLPERGGCLTIDYHLGMRDVCQFYMNLFDASDLDLRKRSHNARPIFYQRTRGKGGKLQTIRVTIPPARRGCSQYELEFATVLRRNRCTQVNIDKLVLADEICGN